MPYFRNLSDTDLTGVDLPDASLYGCGRGRLLRFFADAHKGGRYSIRAVEPAIRPQWPGGEQHQRLKHSALVISLNEAPPKNL